MNCHFGHDRSLSNIPRPPSSKVRSPFWNTALQQQALTTMVATGEDDIASSPFAFPNSGRVSSTAGSNRGATSAVAAAAAAAAGKTSSNSTNIRAANNNKPISEFRAQIIPTPPSPLRRNDTAAAASASAARNRVLVDVDLMGGRTPAEYVKHELDTFEALKRRQLAFTSTSSGNYPDLEELEAKLRNDKFAQHQRDKEMIRMAGGAVAGTSSSSVAAGGGDNNNNNNNSNNGNGNHMTRKRGRNEKLTDGIVTFRGRHYLRYLVPVESTMTRTMRWLFDLRELNVHPVTRMMREAQVSVEHFSQEWLRIHIGANREAGTSIMGDALTRFIQDHMLKTVYVTPAQCLGWYDLLCDKKGTSLDYASGMAKLALILPPEIDDSISVWFTRAVFSGAYQMFRQNDNATPAEFYYIVDALETLVDSSLKRGTIEHRLRDTPSSVESLTNNNNGNSAKPAKRSAAIIQDEFNTTTPQGIMRLIAVVRADIDAYANAVSSRAVRRVDDVLSMFSEESTLPRLMKCGEYQAQTVKYYHMATAKLQAAKQARERAMLRTKSILMGRRLSDA